MKQLIELDGKLLLWIQDDLRFDFLTPIMQFITSLGNAGIFWIVLVVGLLVWKKTRKIGGVAALSLAVTFVINNLLLKNFVQRIRPYEVLQNLELITDRPGDFSFPSGHTANSFAVAVVLYCLLPKKFGIPLVILATLISFSRLYLGVHYPTDVLGGMLIGIACAVICVECMKKKLNI